MRQFFKDQLYEMQIHGIRQMEFMPADLVDKLLDSLVAESRKFSAIPLEDQKQIIRRQCIEDKTLKDAGGLTPGKVHDWFYKAKLTGKYDPRPAAMDFSQQAAPEVADQYAREILGNIATATERKVSPVTEKEIAAVKTEDLERVEGRKSLSVGHKSTTPEQLAERILHHQYLKAKWDWNQDPANYEGQKLKEEFMTEEAWLELQNQSPQ